MAKHNIAEINTYLMSAIYDEETKIPKTILEDLLEIANGGEIQDFNPMDYILDLMWQYRKRHNHDKDEMLVIIGVRHWEELMARYNPPTPTAMYPWCSLELMPSGNWYLAGYRVCIEWKHQYALDFIKVDASQLYEDAVAYEHRKSFARILQDYKGGMI